LAAEMFGYIIFIALSVVFNILPQMFDAI
jgi:hypothetical protein